MEMFRRKAAANVEGEVCPYCEFVNSPGSDTCKQCYYDLNKAPRDQGDVISTEVSDSIFDELMSDDDDTWEETEALDVVLTLDADPLDVSQYDVTDFKSEEPEKIGFMESSSPELLNTVSHEPDAVTVEDVGEAISNVEKLDFSKEDPFAEVPEPVPQGKGAVFSPSAPAKLDDDLLGHVGGLELPSLPPDDLYENKIDLTVKKAPAPTPALVLPDYKPIATTVSEPVTEVPVNAPMAQDFETPQEIVQPEITTPEVKSIPNIPAVVSETPVVTPTPEVVVGIWPWSPSESWDARIVHREVVSALEQVKSGHISEATSTIDALGPHLSDANIDLIYHIGMVLKQIGRTDEVKSMLERAKLAMPDNEHVSSAVAHLGV
tara:strand:+ start:1291 stop:2421 length:1131 start_codon:yes stop_codon:yes gene_type:complete